MSHSMKGTDRKPARTRARANAGDKAAPLTEAAASPEISAEERYRMAECCAFFKAEQYREAGPGTIRSQDIEVAEAEIEAIIRRCCSE